jgi:hypothetical protein
MSEESYQSNVDLGITGSESSSCELASYDRISWHHGISSELYQRFNLLFDSKPWSQIQSGEMHMSQAILEECLSIRKDAYAELGVYSGKNLVRRRVETQEQLEITMGTLALGGYRIGLYVWTGGTHAVGVQQNEDGTNEVRSTWSPIGESRVTIQALFSVLDQPPRLHRRPTSSRRTAKVINVKALPPERS